MPIVRVLLDALVVRKLFFHGLKSTPTKHVLTFCSSAAGGRSLGPFDPSEDPEITARSIRWLPSKDEEYGVVPAHGGALHLELLLGERVDLDERIEPLRALLVRRQTEGVPVGGIPLCIRIGVDARTPSRTGIGRDVQKQVAVLS